MLVLLVAAPFLLYCSAFGLGLLQIDDLEYYMENPALHNGGIAGLKDVWTTVYFNDYIPVSHLTMWLDLAMGHGHPFVLARFQQLVWLGLGTLAVVQVLFRISGRPGLSYTVGLLYCLHPVTAESVLWLGERKNLVAFALTWWCFYHHIAWRQDKRAWSGWLAAALCALAILAKLHPVMIPAVLATYEALYGTGLWRNRVLAVLPSAALSIAFILVSVLYIRPDIVHGPSDHSLPASVFCDGAILLRYVVHAYVPQHLAMFYYASEDPGRWVILSACWICVMGLVAITCAMARERRLMIFAWTAAAMSLMPALNLAYQLQTMSDHYLQWALPFLLLIPCQLLGEYIRSARPLDWDKSVRFLVIGYAVLLSLLSWSRVSEFSSLRNAMMTGMRHDPDCGLNWAGYCHCLVGTGQPGPDDMEEAGRAGLKALRCPDRSLIFVRPYVSCMIYGIWECQRTEGSQAADDLLAQGLPKAGSFAPFIEGMIALLEGHTVQAQQALEKIYTTEDRAAAQRLATQCREGDLQPWEAAPMVDFSSMPGDKSALRLGISFSIQQLAALADAYRLNGDFESCRILSALLVNMSPQYPAAMTLYRESCHRLGLEASVQRVDQELLLRKQSALAASPARSP